MTPHKGTENKENKEKRQEDFVPSLCSLRLCVNFFLCYHTKAQRTQGKDRKALCLFVFFAALCENFFMTPHNFAALCEFF